MDLGLADKVAFVTGAAGGIGRTLVDAFVAEGARVALCVHRTDAESSGRSGRTKTVRADVCEPSSIEAALGEVAVAWGRVDVCVANAGVWPPAEEPLHEMAEARIRDVVSVNLLGAVWTARAFLKALAKSGPRPDGQGTSLVFIGSTAGRFGEKGHAEYAISKSGLYGLVRSLKNEIVALDPHARVNLVEPGWTITPMAQASIDQGVIESATRTMPLRQLALAEDVARAVVFLSSPTAARHVTGETIGVSGGMEGRVLW